MKKTIMIITALISLLMTIAYTKNPYTILDYPALNALQHEDRTLLVDARLNDYYNGWQDPITQTHGHLKNATDFSANWIKTLADSADKNRKSIALRLNYELNNKGIRQADKIIVYSSSLKEASLVADYFTTEGINANNIFIYILDSTAQYELVTIKDYHRLVSPKFVYDLITTGEAEGYTKSDYQLFEVSWGSSTGSYDRGHIDHSVHIDTGDFEHPPLWSLDDDKDLIKFAQKYGINKNATIIFYGEDPMASFRAAVIVEYMGAKDVRVLNGGLKTYVDAGYELSKKSYKADKNSELIFDFAGKKLIDTYEDIQAKMSKDWQLVDGRTKAEHEGKITGYSDLAYKGTIPNSIFHGARFADNSGSVADYINVDNTMRNITDIIKMLSEAGVDVNKHMSFYCGTGWRVAQMLFYLQINGYTDSSIYANGWYEYSDKNLK